MQVYSAIGLAATSRKVRQLAGWVFVISFLVLIGSVTGLILFEMRQPRSGAPFIIGIWAGVPVAFWSAVIWLGAIVMKWLLTDDSNKG